MTGEPVRRLCAGLAISGTMLGLASAAGAQGRPVEALEAGKSAPVLIEPERGPLFRDQRRGFSLSQQSFVREDGSPGSGTRLIGSLPVSDSVDVGVGIFSIVGQTEKESVRRRTDPQRDVRVRDGRMAAVGFALRF